MTASLGQVGNPVNIVVRDVQLWSGVASHQLDFLVEIEAPSMGTRPDSNWESMLLDAQVHAGNPRRPLGFVHSRMIHVRPFRTKERLSLMLGDDQVLQLEIDRGEDGLDFQLDLNGHLFDAAPRDFPGSSAQCVHRISAQRWLEMLEACGAAVGITVRVPSPLGIGLPATTGANDPEPSLVRAAERLRQARRALRDGDAAGCVRACRQVLENIERLRKPDLVESLRSKSPRTRTQQERWSALHHDLYSLASGASHDDAVTEDFTWSRADAQAVLAGTAGLLARVAQAVS